MSNYPLRSLHSERLDRLFSDLGQETVQISPNNGDQIAGWTWECDAEGFYIKCGPEIEDLLGIDPQTLLGTPLAGFALTSQSTELIETAITGDQFPIELNITYLDSENQLIPAFVNILRRQNTTRGNGISGNLHGFTRVIQDADLVAEKLQGSLPEVTVAIDSIPPITTPGWPKPSQQGPKHQQSLGYLVENDSNNGQPSEGGNPKITPTTTILTSAGVESLTTLEAVLHDAETGDPAILAMPVQVGDGQTSVLLELLDESTRRTWKNEERLLVEQVANQLSLALENAQLFEQTQNALAETEIRAHELSLLNEMSRELSSHLDVDSIIQKIYHYTSRLIDTNNFYVALYHPEEEQLSFHHVISDNQYVDEEHPEWPDWGPRQPLAGLTEHVIRTKQALLVEDNAQNRLNQLGLDYILVGDGGVESWLGVPMNIGDQVIGVVTVQSETTPRLYTQHHRELLTAIANQSAIAIQNAYLFEESRRRYEDLDSLNAIIGAASRSLDLVGTLQEILTHILRLTGYPIGLISALNPSTKRLILVAHQNLPEPLLNNLSHEGFDGTLCDLVYEQGEVILVEDFQNDAPIDVSGLIDMGLCSYLGIPLKTKDKVLGTACVFSDVAKTTEEINLDLMEAVSRQVGVAIENAILFAQTQKALAETKTLYTITTAASHTQDMDKMLGLVLNQVLANTQYDCGLISVENPKTNRLELVSHHGLPESLVKKLASGLDGTLCDLVFKERKPFGLEDFEQHAPLDISGLSEMGLHSYYGVPLFSKGKILGTLCVFGKSIKTKGAENAQLMEVAAQQVGVAIENIHLLEETKRRADQLQTAAEIARDTTSTLALDRLLDRAVELICEGFGYYHATIFLLDENDEYALALASTGEAGEEMKRQKHKLKVGSKSIIGYVTQSGKPLIINDVSKNPIHALNPLLPNTKAESGLPLKIGQRVIGAFDVQSNQVNAFKPDDINVLQSLADQIAVAVDNARAYELSLQAVEEMRQADQLKSQFLANMSHELRTPLNSIIGFSRVILKGIDGPITELQEQDLSAIYNSGQHLLSLINDILDLSKIEAGKMELTLEENVNMVDLINSVMSTMVGLVKDKPIEIVKDIQPDLPKARADPIKVRQILINLLSNAAKFTDQGSITIEAKSHKSSRGRPQLLFSVTDTGPGISPEDQKKLFQPFTQVDGSPTRKTGGSGLGLSISRHLVEMHRGQIGVTSDHGMGSTFYFTLPVSGTKTGMLNIQEQEVETNMPVILAIDGEQQIINLYERYVSEYEYQIYPLSDPLKALETAKRLQPYAITLDIMMPGHDGWRVLNQLKSDPETRHIPVIIFSILEERGKGFGLGAFDYLTKPILENDLVNALDRLNQDGTIREVLVVDDDPEDLRLVYRIFQDRDDYQVTLAEGGKQALVAIRSRQPHAIVLDLFMPDLDGFSLIETLRADPSLQDIPIIAFTTADFSEKQRKRFDKFSQGMIRKGLLNEEELFHRIEQLLKRYRFTLDD
jgi:GAF domain-containing protein/CheY-like chemotaxis protein